MNMARLVQQLKQDEGFAGKPYQDSVGVWTIGYGRNLDDNGISEPEAAALLRSDAQVAVDECVAAVAAWASLDGTRQEVLVNMMFNLGRHRFLGFVRMLSALNAGDYDEASIEMLDSKWAKQVKGRAIRLSEQMRIGDTDVEI